MQNAFRVIYVRYCFQNKIPSVIILHVGVILYYFFLSLTAAYKVEV